MPSRTRTHTRKDRKDYEDRVESVKQNYKTGTHKSTAEAARVHKVACQTLNDMVNGPHKSMSQVYKAQNPAKRTYNKIMVKNKELSCQKKLLETQLVSVAAQLNMANAHCKTMLKNNKKKTHKSAKIESQFVTHAEMRAAFEAERAEHQEKEREAEEKVLQKMAACMHRIMEDTDKE